MGLPLPTLQVGNQGCKTSSSLPQAIQRVRNRNWLRYKLGYSHLQELFSVLPGLVMGQRAMEWKTKMSKGIKL